eukprot:TRINITY_DN58335_c0_g1_i1.p1 TRINITY_DN58335_c0_g1~~TRINITY_DN58335_c0_g1_i1.p1  ORF type:complete len:304 (-),score=23.42 TRINITY_DN58335_c0_g1_i1:617-1498(-)
MGIISAARGRLFWKRLPLSACLSRCRSFPRRISPAHLLGCFFIVLFGCAMLMRLWKLNSSARVASINTHTSSRGRQPSLRSSIDTTSFASAPLADYRDPNTAEALKAQGKVEPEGKRSIVELRVNGIGATIKIRLRPDLSSSSTDFLMEATSSAQACTDGSTFYRAEKAFLIQGRFDCPRVTAKVEKGPCPAGSQIDRNRKCFAHDPNCGCHGPIMTPGMIGWAGGGAGPDFFIYVGEGPNTNWAHDHTVFGELADADSWIAVNAILRRSVAQRGGMSMLEQPLRLSLQRSVP